MRFSRRSLTNYVVISSLSLLIVIVEGGYCQSMNFIAALLLSYMDNELAFYTQVCLNRDFFNGYFTDELVCHNYYSIH